MTFLTPNLLWMILPFIGLPILIHLVNRMRYTQVDWAAMDFITRARSSSTSMAKLREILILALRALLILALALALGRPLAGGWLGWAGSGSPDTLVIILDRSASMNGRGDGWKNTKREEAADSLASAAAQLSPRRIVLIDSATQQSRTLSKPEELRSAVLYGDTDSSCDMPRLVEKARGLLAEGGSGRSELWIASDLQASSWAPRSEEWSRLSAGLKALPGAPAVRLLALTAQVPGNGRISLLGAAEIRNRGQREIELELFIRRADKAGTPVNLILILDGQQRSLAVDLKGQEGRIRQSLRLPKDSPGGWGSLSLPVDGNPADNTVYFAYGPAQADSVAVASAEPRAGKLLGLLAAPAPDLLGVKAVEVNPADPAASILSRSSLLIWNAPVPGKAVAARIRSFVDAGGSLIVLPTGASSSWPGLFDWKAPEGGQDLAIHSWEESRGLLAKSASGKSLALDRLVVRQRQIPSGEGVPLARFADGQPFLLRRSLGKGLVCTLAAGISPSSSELRQGTILIPLLRRLQLEGSRRNSGVTWMNCGGDTGGLSLQKLSANRDSVPATSSAGVWKHDAGFLVASRPDGEDEAALLPAKEAGELFRGLDVNLLEAGGSHGGSGDFELWRLVFGLLLALMVVEGFLTLRRPLSK
jgi:hypothetical protein